ncbi:ribosome biogenesis GTPase YlqF [Lentilactobacillus sp. Marseille-Q4993]|uniref:ribosome biogenesis GTPase YlqF n=1 Tax=Lentilactobacillus sp. Marseille-Q4993 TaxID=3039492 RepID=UPI0024BD44A9|nr:ribosome biogenesis GTPase YlqF [Lentilactobacillus sp. Marseille-Q4993]
MAVNIQWFPGHMAKAIRQFEENISVVDIVFEILDARIPFSSMNPEVKRISGDKPHLYILTKKDLADPNRTQDWLRYFRENGQPAIAVDAKTKFGIKNVLEVIEPILADKLQRERDKGMKTRPIRAVSVGVPNVGKSTVLNRLVNRKAAQVGNRPGVTKGQQWMKSNNGELELLDTPGILWPKFANQELANKLALTGAVKETAYSSDDIALYALDFFREFSPKSIMERYHLNESALELTTVDLLMEITSKIGMKDDYMRSSERIIQDVRSNKLRPFTLDLVSEVESNDD